MITPDFTSELLFFEFAHWLIHYRYTPCEGCDGFFPNKEYIDYLHYGEEEDGEDVEVAISNPSRTAFVDELVKPFFSEPAFEENIKNILEINVLPPIEEINFSALYEN
jgi:hypothetical protein